MAKRNEATATNAAKGLGKFGRWIQKKIKENKEKKKNQKNKKLTLGVPMKK